jgi:sugar fermentation stimulation protein A
MRWQPELIEGRFIKRYKRFFADVEINGKIEVAHVPNTGSLKGCLIEGAPCLLQPATDPKRKLRFTLEMIKTPTSWVGVNTANPPKLLAELLKKGSLTHWQEYDSHQWEVALDAETRLDVVLWSSGDSFPADHKLKKADVQKNDRPLHFVEIKNVTLAEGDVALFPDCETTRGQKHLRELTALVERGHKAEMVYVIQRSDCYHFAPAVELDPVYAQLLKSAVKSGVQITPLVCAISPDEIQLSAKPVSLRL